ncbi:uncharacterized protein AB675_7659 [Cyphellophora attinorum]|uniref:Uncharacterized protein n=1 Tax=Cyphellophora attinorum TaxID=1664694 RepID=A0A0N1H4N7_9EURO|nr:uncharacterized protein AB675_7659 [Phialophora attinorum]KPI40364.1 hypothetical protein AB675_7659 [Phialophora attinorum]
MLRTFLKALVCALALRSLSTASSANPAPVALSQDISISTINNTLATTILSTQTAPDITPCSMQSPCSGTACPDPFEEMVTVVVGPSRSKVSAHSWAWKRVNFTPTCPKTWIAWRNTPCVIERRTDDVEAWKGLRNWAYHANFTDDLEVLKKAYFQADYGAWQTRLEEYDSAVLRRMSLYLLASRLSAEELANTIIDNILDSRHYWRHELLQKLIQLVLDSDETDDAPVRSFLKHLLAEEALLFDKSWLSWRRYALLFKEYQFYTTGLDRLEFLVDTMMQFPSEAPQWPLKQDASGMFTNTHQTAQHQQPRSQHGQPRPTQKHLFRQAGGRRYLGLWDLNESRPPTRQAASTIVAGLGRRHSQTSEVVSAGLHSTGVPRLIENTMGP